MRLFTLTKALVSLSLFACTSLFAAPLVVDVTGVQSVGAYGNIGNTVFNYNIGAGSTVTSIGFNVNLTAYAPSWLSEIGVAFTDSAGYGVIFNPGGGNMLPGTASYAGYFELSDYGLVFPVGADGILRIEFYEDYNDFTGPDGVWNFGTLTFGITTAAVDVPEPGAGVLLGAGLAMMAYAVRRRARLIPAVAA